MRLAYDATALIGPRTGVGVFTSEVLARLARRSDLEVIAFGVTWRGRSTLADRLPPGISLTRRPMAARPLRMCWSRSSLAPIEWWTGAADVVHGPNYVVPPSRGAAAVVTVHDLTFLRYPAMCTPDTLQYPGLIRRALARGATVHTGSRFVADELLESFDVEPERVVVIPDGVRLPDGDGGVAPGAKPDAAPDAASDPASGTGLVPGGPFILALGTVEPRKDLPLLVRAFDILAHDEPDLRLVIAGPDGWGASELSGAVAASPNRSRIIRTGWVDDRRRVALMRAACVYAFPSIYEGFGLPPLEAMASGTPVVATSAGALPEVLGDAASLVAPGDAGALAAALGRVLHDESWAATLVSRGHRRVEGYSWQSTADQLVELYRRVADRGR